MFSKLDSYWDNYDEIYSPLFLYLPWLSSPSMHLWYIHHQFKYVHLLDATYFGLALYLGTYGWGQVPEGEYVYSFVCTYLE
jgi:hypothetical protein